MDMDSDRQGVKRTNDSRELPTWREMNMDTTPETEAVLFKMWRETPAWRKLRMMEELNRSALQLSLIGLKQRYPNASAAELRRRLADMVLGAELAVRVYGPMTS